MVVLAGVYGAMAALGGKPSDITKQTFVVCGAGSAGMGIANFLHTAMVHHGLTPEQAHARFFVVDKHGLVTSERVLDDDAPGAEICGRSRRADEVPTAPARARCTRARLSRRWCDTRGPRCFWAHPR